MSPLRSRRYEKPAVAIGRQPRRDVPRRVCVTRLHHGGRLASTAARDSTKEDSAGSDRNNAEKQRVKPDCRSSESAPVSTRAPRATASRPRTGDSRRDSATRQPTNAPRRSSADSVHRALKSAPASCRETESPSTYGSGNQMKRARPARRPRSSRAILRRPSGRARCPAPRHQRQRGRELALSAGHGISASAVVTMSRPTNRASFGP